jgi:hypothetical protein
LLVVTFLKRSREDVCWKNTSQFGLLVLLTRGHRIEACLGEQLAEGEKRSEVLHLSVVDNSDFAPNRLTAL